MKFKHFIYNSKNIILMLRQLKKTLEIIFIFERIKLNQQKGKV